MWWVYDFSILALSSQSLQWRGHAFGWDVGGFVRSGAGGVVSGVGRSRSASLELRVALSMNSCERQIRGDAVEGKWGLKRFMYSP